MNKILKIVSIVLNITVVIIALGVIGYFLLFAPYIQKVYQQGSQDTLKAILQQIQQQGQVQIGQTTLVVKTNTINK